MSAAAGTRTLALLCCATLAAVPLAARPQEPSRPAAEVAREIRDLGKEAPGPLFQELAGIGSEEAFELLVDIVGDLPAGHPRATAAMNSLRAFRGKAALEARAIEFLAERAGRENGYPVLAARSLAAFGEAARPQLLRLLQESNRRGVREACLPPVLDALAGIGTPQALALLLENHAGTDTARMPRTVEVLAAFPGETLLEELDAWLEEEAVRQEVRASLVAAVGRLAGEDADEALRDCLAKGCPAWRKRAALHALRERGGDSHRRELARLVRDEDPLIAHLAVVEEGRLRQGEPAWERANLKRARSRDAAERRAAAEAMAYVAPSAAAEVLPALFADDDRTVRVAAYRAAAVVRSAALVAPLLERMEAEDAATRPPVHAALLALTAQSLPASPGMWRRWWEEEGADFRMPTREEAEAARVALRAAARPAAGDTVSSFFDLPVVSERVVFVVDSSQSMDLRHRMQGGYDEGQLDTRMKIARAQLKSAVRGLPEGALFNIVFFDDGFEVWREGMVRRSAETLREAEAYVDARPTRFKTAVFDALKRVLTDLEMDFDTLYLLSDGEPYGGETDDPSRIRAFVRDWNSLRGVVIHAVSIGGTVGLMRDLAADNGGEFRAVK